MIRINNLNAIKFHPNETMGVIGVLKLQEIEPHQTINGLSYRKDNGKWMIAPMSEEDHIQAQYIKPILISKIDSIDVDDFVLDYYENGKPANIRKVVKIVGNKIYDSESVYNTKKYIDKVIALPEHFANKHLNDIVSGKLKENDEIIVKCIFKSLHWMEAATANDKEFKPIVELISDSYIFIL